MLQKFFRISEFDHKVIERNSRAVECAHLLFPENLRLAAIFLLSFIFSLFAFVTVIRGGGGSVP